MRERVWGKAWERVRDALARAGTSGDAAEDGADESTGEADVGSQEEVASASRERRGGTGRSGEADDAAKDDPESRDAPSSSVQAASDDATDDSGADGGARGAGNATSPGDLFAGSAVDTAATDASFELSLAARMRSDEAGRRRAGGPPPDADPDARPVLADDQHRETAAHRMTVPAAYEQVVREVYAHDEEP